MIKTDIQYIQGLFEMEDINKNLKYNSINLNQLKRTQKFEKHIQSLLEKLYVPEN